MPDRVISVPQAAQIATRIKNKFDNVNGRLQQYEEIFTGDVGESVQNWLDAHPEATTTVTDGSLTEAKFSDALKKLVVKDYLTPEMYGAVGNGTADDTSALQQACTTANGKRMVILSGTYKITNTITLPNNTYIKGVGKAEIVSYVTQLFSADLTGIVVENLRFTNSCTDVDEDGKTLGSIFGDLHMSKINNIRAQGFYSIFSEIRECTSIINSTFLTLKKMLGNGATDSFIIGNYINGSQAAPFNTIMMRFLNNSSFASNFVDYWYTCFRFQAGNRSAQITGNTFDDCVAVFRDYVSNVSITGNTFSNIKYVEANWNSDIKADISSLSWGIFVFDFTSKNTSGTLGTPTLERTVFCGNLFRNIQYYIYIDGSNAVNAVYLKGYCQFRGNAGIYSFFAGFLVTSTSLANGAMDNLYFDFWENRVFESLPRPGLTASSGATNSRVESYKNMQCYVAGEKYINIEGVWKKYTFA